MGNRCTQELSTPNIIQQQQTKEFKELIKKESIPEIEPFNSSDEDQDIKLEKTKVGRTSRISKIEEKENTTFEEEEESEQELQVPHKCKSKVTGLFFDASNVSYKQISGDISEYFTKTQELGEGGFGKIFQVIRPNSNNTTYAMKEIELQKVKMNNEQQFLAEEIQIQSKLNFPYIMKVHQVLKNQTHMWIVMDMCKGGDLFGRVVEDQVKYSEQDAKKLIYYCVLSIAHMHAKGYMHRDLKLENILMQKKNDNTQVMLIDFGISAAFKKENGVTIPLKECAGTQQYRAPEVEWFSYDETCDCFSLGIMLYMMLTGSELSRNNSKLFKDYYNSGVFPEASIFRQTKWKTITPNCKDFFKQMTKKQSERLTSVQAINHPWFADIKKEFEIDYASMIQFAFSSKLKRIVLSNLSMLVDQNEHWDTGCQFLTICHCHKGTLSIEEFKESFLKNSENLEKKINYKFTEDDIKVLFQKIATCTTGCICYSEFLASNLKKQIYMQPDNLMACFNLFAKNEKITSQDLQEQLTKGHFGSDNSTKDYYGDKNIKEFENLLNQDKCSGEGYQDFEMFKQMMDFELDYKNLPAMLEKERKHLTKGPQQKNCC